VLVTGAAGYLGTVVPIIITVVSIVLVLVRRKHVEPAVT
jgi:hypothetical protein